VRRRHDASRTFGRSWSLAGAELPATSMHAPPAKSVLLVGPGEHFGLHLARRFAAEGFAVGLLARNRERLNSMMRTLAADGIAVAVATADVGEPARLTQIVRRLASQLPPLACVIFNVKASRRGNALEVSPEEIATALAINVAGAVALIQAVMPLLAPAQHPSIILTGGGYKDRPDENKFILSISKAALHAVFLSLSLTLEPRSVRLRTIVIDGLVRENGPIRSADVAETFWIAHTSSGSRAIRIPERRVKIDRRQATLFPEAPEKSIYRG
jgi:NAD(P)-dependent dehydrogenase (short-subunit alcohol dehydrogenase family)